MEEAVWDGFCAHKGRDKGRRAPCSSCPGEQHCSWCVAVAQDALGIVSREAGWTQNVNTVALVPSMSAAGEERASAGAKGRPARLAGYPSYCLGNTAWNCCLVTCQLLTESGVGRPPFSKPKACLPDRIWIEWLALREPRLIGLKEKKCYFSSPKTTKRNGETKILFRLNKLQGDSLGRFQRVR